MGRIAHSAIYMTLATCIVGSCSAGGGTQDHGADCVTTASARVCGAVDNGRLVVTADGLKPGSILRVNVEGQYPVEWIVSEKGNLTDLPGALGFLSYSGKFGTVSIEAIAADGASVSGEVFLD